jgi:hypothetical protein
MVAICVGELVLGALGLLDDLHHVHAFRDAPENGVLVVQPRARHRRNEELRTVCEGGIEHEYN